MTYTDEIKATRLVDEMNRRGVTAELFWDRGPYCARVPITHDIEDEYAPSLFIFASEELFDPMVSAFGWKWHGSFGGYEDSEELGLLADSTVMFEIIERNHLGDTEEDVARAAIQLVNLLKNGALKLAQVRA